MDRKAARSRQRPTGGRSWRAPADTGCSGSAVLEAAAVMRFGYGIGVAYPPIWLEPLQISRGFDQVLAPGMVFVLHAYLQLLGESLGVIQGGTYALTDRGLETLVGGGDVELEVV